MMSSVPELKTKDTLYSKKYITMIYTKLCTQTDNTMIDATQHQITYNTMIVITLLLLKQTGNTMIDPTLYVEGLPISRKI